MAQNIQLFFDNLTQRNVKPFTLEDLPGFPYQEYQFMISKYEEAEYWYSGEALTETVEQSGRTVERYPVQINPLPGTVEKHAHFLFGQVDEDDRPLVNARMIPRKVKKEEGEEVDKNEKDKAFEAEEVLAKVWYESHGRSLQLEGGFISQVYGGTIFRLAYDPFDPLREIPIRIESVHPKFFLGIPDASDMWRLREAWIVKPVTRDEALEHNVRIADEDEGWLVEHYTITEYTATINGQNCKRFFDGDWIDVNGRNPWGFVPIVYIPHIRVGGFWGVNIIDALKGIVKELNLRIADYGDAVTVDSHAYVGMRGVSGAPQIQQLAAGLHVVNLGSTPNLSGNEVEPDLFEIRKPSASEPMGKLIELLYSFYRRIAYIPSVVDGEDEGSQRSGLTLAMRSLALTSHTDTERVFWTDGLVLLNRMILRMLAAKGEAGITPEHAVLNIKLEWAPPLPRDREMVVNEAVSLMAAKLGSPERLLELLGVEDTEEEAQKILDFWEELAKIEAKANPMMQQGKPGQPGSGPSAKPDKGLARSSTNATKASTSSEE